MKVVLSGGGSGGHITPLLATAAALKRLNPDTKLHYVGVKSQAEVSLLRGQDLTKHWISAGKYRRYPGSSWWQRLLDVRTWLLNLTDIFKLLTGLVQSRRLLKRLQPDVVFVKGGYVGLPVGLAAAWLKIPLVIHESDLLPGLTNRMLAKRATRIATSLPARYYPQWQSFQPVATGIPLRPELLAARATGPDHLPTLLVVGGSSGARVINDAVVKQLPQLTARLRVVHISGRRDFSLVKEAVAATGPPDAKHYQLHEFMNAAQLGRALAEADVVVSRSGMTAVAEVAVFAKALVTIPIAVSTHQHQNAQLLEEQQAAVVVEETDLAQQLWPAVERLLNVKAEQQRLGRNLQGLFPADAAAQLATLITQSRG